VFIVRSRKKHAPEGDKHSRSARYSNCTGKRSL
jgi:hypothetical protein